jgi:DNA-binding LacI/PurR family transcriptional regulator
MRIRAAAERLGYVPNLAARALATRRSGLVGILLYSATEPLAAAFVDALDDPLRREGMVIVLARVEGPGQSLTGVRELLSRGVDAILCWDATFSPEAYRLVAGQGTPCLLLPDATGRRAGAALAGRYLVSLGHQRIGVLAPNLRAEAAIRESLAESGGEVVTVELALDPSTDSQACAALLEQPDRPTAVVCASDLDAVALLRECHARGIDVPGDVSVVGFGDTELARRAWPSLTTIRVGIGELAARVVETLVAMLAQETREAPEPAVKLVVRESTDLAAR